LLLPVPVASHQADAKVRAVWLMGS
jgi:hypothetical protein